MTQKNLVIDYIKANGSILPAKISGVIYKGTMFGSETSKRCRELRQAGILIGRAEGKFERFYLKRQDPLPSFQSNLFQPSNNKG